MSRKFSDKSNRKLHRDLDDLTRQELEELLEHNEQAERYLEENSLDAKDFGPYWLQGVQGTLAEERKKSTGRLGKDLKEFKQVQKLNLKNRITLFDLLSCSSTTGQVTTEEKRSGIDLLEDRLSHLGARYPSVPGLGIYVKGLSSLEGKSPGKKAFDLMFWIVSKPDLKSYYKFILFEKLGKLILNQRNQGKWMQNCTTLLVLSGLNEVAYDFGVELLENQSAIRDSLKRGEALARKIYFQFYDNTNPYSPKVRRRGYSRSSPVRPGSSKKAILEANTSIEYLTESGTLRKSEGGGYEMTEKRLDTGELLFKIFSNSLEAFQLQQQEVLEQLRSKRTKPPETPETGDQLHNSKNLKGGSEDE